MKIEVICCGLSTVDVQLHACEVPLHLEHITPFSHTTSTAGGSAPQTAQSLSALSIPVTALTSIGNDEYGQTLTSLLKSNNVDTSCLVHDDSHSPTALAILPLFTDGRRGCFVTLGANLTFNPKQALETAINQNILCRDLKAFHFGYPHLMPNFQRQQLLDHLFIPVTQHCPNAFITLDLNGASTSEKQQPIITPSLSTLTHVHANLEEACTVTGLYDPSTAHTLTASHVFKLCTWFISRGVATVSITCGRHGAFLATSSLSSILTKAHLNHSVIPTNAFIHRSAFYAGKDEQVNASGAGDAFVAGIIAQLIHSEGGACGVSQLLDSGLASALRRIDQSLVSGPTAIDVVVEKALQRSRIPPRAPLLVDYENLKLGE